MMDLVLLLRGQWFSHHILPLVLKPSKPNYRALFKEPAAVFCWLTTGSTPRVTVSLIHWLSPVHFQVLRELRSLRLLRRRRLTLPVNIQIKGFNYCSLLARGGKRIKIKSSAVRSYSTVGSIVLGCCLGEAGTACLYKPVGCNLEGVGLSRSLGVNSVEELIKKWSLLGISYEWKHLDWVCA